MRQFASFLILIFTYPTLMAQEVRFHKESIESISNYLMENNIEFKKNDLVTLKNMNAFSVYNTNKLLVVPEIYFFNKEGYRVKNFNGANCGQELQNLEKINKKKIDKSDIITNWTKYFTFSENNDENILESDYEFFIIINWAKFIPKQNEISFNWYQSLKNYKNYKIKIIFLNLDVQEDWVLTDVEKKALKLE